MNPVAPQIIIDQCLYMNQILDLFQEPRNIPFRIFPIENINEAELSTKSTMKQEEKVIKTEDQVQSLPFLPKEKRLNMKRKKIQINFQSKTSDSKRGKENNNNNITSIDNITSKGGNIIDLEQQKNCNYLRDKWLLKDDSMDSEPSRKKRKISKTEKMNETAKSKLYGNNDGNGFDIGDENMLLFIEMEQKRIDFAIKTEQQQCRKRKNLNYSRGHKMNKKGGGNRGDHSFRSHFTSF